ncbi:amidohydrolase [Desulfobacterium sp. N47]|uniref:5-methylthioadenosine/S-adenosylhomocysteine deaminase n=1 Tax=uncultured Desulfobacterium sp. TaxID=201089 RepID=E1YIK1_9BACT|nr:5-methylthioadenosine/S-adenosylhomocysteinedeaminase [uncultured Desulfobacterium sp.]
MNEFSADLLIINGTLVLMDRDNTIIRNGAVAVKKDLIAAAGKAEELADYKATRTIDANGGIIMPGLVNAHTHASMAIFRGLADDLPLMTWLNDHIFPAESKLSPERVYDGALLACAEMIQSGITSFCDMYLFEDYVAQAALDAGMRAVVGEVLYDFPSPNYGPIEKGFLYTKMLIEKYRDNPLIKIAVEPHSTYLCAPTLLKKASLLAKENDLLLVIHVAETKSEVSQIKEKYGLTPVGFLEDTGVLSSNLLACHCVHLTDDDILLLKKYDVKVAHNPESNMKLASGIAPVPKLLKQEICTAIGTDGCASNNNLDIFHEMSLAAKLGKISTFDPSAMNAESVLKMATIDGAKALGISDIAGSIEVGKKADIIIIDTVKPHLTPMYNPVSGLVYAARASDVTTSVINGRIVMENGNMLSINVKTAAEKVRSIAQEIV